MDLDLAHISAFESSLSRFRCSLFVTMKSALILACIAASASAFTPAKQAATASVTAATKSDLETIAEKANPVVKFYDPLNLAEADFYGMGSEATIGFLRQSEIKVRFPR